MRPQLAGRGPFSFSRISPTLGALGSGKAICQACMIDDAFGVAGGVLTPRPINCRDNAMDKRDKKAEGAVDKRNEDGRELLTRGPTKFTYDDDFEYNFMPSEAHCIMLTHVQIDDYRRPV